MEKQKRLLLQMIAQIQSVIDTVDMFEASRPGSIAFTKLEEAILWIQVLIQAIPLKKEHQEDETKVEPSVAA
jgi:hypothetical protein